MSRIGRQLVTIPESVTVTTGDKLVVVKGPKGELIIPVKDGITVFSSG